MEFRMSSTFDTFFYILTAYFPFLVHKIIANLKSSFKLQNSSVMEVILFEYLNWLINKMQTNWQVEKDNWFLILHHGHMKISSVTFLILPQDLLHFWIRSVNLWIHSAEFSYLILWLYMECVRLVINYLLFGEN